MVLKVEFYEFGKIRIDGKVYHEDLIILPDKMLESWRRARGHELRLDDLKEVLEANIDCLIIGTGYYGMMKVLDEVLEYFREKGVKVIIKPTKEACETYNELVDAGRRAALALHLTC
ncbi:MAG TPA: hypothetical protein ENG18_01425 [Nitrososphaeria archaeon]|nr:hypothetical protein [Nitrososphaeria archaeon]